MHVHAMHIHDVHANSENMHARFMHDHTSLSNFIAARQLQLFDKIASWII